MAFVAARGNWSPLSTSSARYWRRGAPIHERDDGLWELNLKHDALRSARHAVRERIATARRWAHMRPDPAVLAANRKHFEGKREAHAERLARLAGYEDVNDADRLGRDPAMRWIVGGRAVTEALVRGEARTVVSHRRRVGGKAGK
jgi:hypothetical protein